jgi:hypothetical protein
MTKGAAAPAVRLSAVNKAAPDRQELKLDMGECSPKNAELDESIDQERYKKFLN